MQLDISRCEMADGMTYGGHRYDTVDVRSSTGSARKRHRTTNQGANQEGQKPSEAGRTSKRPGKESWRKSQTRDKSGATT